MADPRGRPLGIAPGEAFHVSNAIQAPKPTRLSRPNWDSIAAVIFACGAFWFFVAYLFGWHV